LPGLSSSAAPAAAAGRPARRRIPLDARSMVFLPRVTSGISDDAHGDAADGRVRVVGRRQRWSAADGSEQARIRTQGEHRVVGREGSPLACLALRQCAVVLVVGLRDGRPQRRHFERPACQVELRTLLRGEPRDAVARSVAGGRRAPPRSGSAATPGPG